MAPHRVLTIASHHPDLVPGDAQSAAHALFGAMRAAPDLDAFFLAGVQHYLTPQLVKPEGAIWAHAGRPDEFLFTVRGFDPFWLSNTGQHEAGWRQVIATLAALRPDVVLFASLVDLGAEVIRAVRVACPAARVFLTLRDLSLPTPIGSSAREPPATAAEAALGFADRGPAEIALRAEWLRAHLGWVDGFVATSEFARARHSEWGLPAERIAVIRPGLPDRRVAPAPPSPRRNRFGLFGALAEERGLAVTLDAVQSLLARDLDDFVLTVGGSLREASPALRRRLDEMAAASPQLRVAAGARSGPETVDWAIVPTLLPESAPPEVEQAFLSGRPVLGSDAGGLSERVQDGISGLLFPPGDGGALSDRMAECLADPGLWDRLAAGIPAVPDMAEELAAWRALWGRSETAVLKPEKRADALRVKAAAGRRA